MFLAGKFTGGVAYIQHATAVDGNFVYVLRGKSDDNSATSQSLFYMDARVETWAKIDTGGKKFEFNIIGLVFQSNYPTNVRR